MGDKIATSVNVSAMVEINDEIRKNAEEQYGITNDQEIANNMLYIIVGNGILDANVKDCYWDGVVKMKRNIKSYDVV
jgi:post-segregation antitoxin (ccd killing protein)